MLYWQCGRCAARYSESPTVLTNLNGRMVNSSTSRCEICKHPLREMRD